MPASTDVKIGSGTQYMLSHLYLEIQEKMLFGVPQNDRNGCKSMQLVSGGLSPHHVHVASTVPHSMGEASFAKLEDGKAQ
jgi:hypothetical protein